MSPDDRKYTETHEWVRDDGGVYVIGITEAAAEKLGDITYVELPEVGRAVKRDEEVAVIESIKAASDVYSPLKGHIVEVNETLDAEPEIINRSPFEDGWIFRLEGADTLRRKGLLNAEEYDRLAKEL